MVTRRPGQNARRRQGCWLGSWGEVYTGVSFLMPCRCVLQLDQICISFDEGKTTMNFIEAALLIQGSACVYSKKVGPSGCCSCCFRIWWDWGSLPCWLVHCPSAPRPRLLPVSPSPRLPLPQYLLIQLGLIIGQLQMRTVLDL